MSKACLFEISRTIIKYENIPVTSHTPYLLAKIAFFPEKRDSKVGCQFSNSIFAI